MTFKQNKNSKVFFKKHLNFFDLDFARKNASTLLKKGHVCWKCIQNLLEFFNFFFQKSFEKVRHEIFIDDICSLVTKCHALVRILVERF